MIQTNTIYNENCLEGMKRIPDGSIDTIICDLPYGTTACSWDVILPFDQLWEQYRRVIKENGAIVLFGAEPFSTLLRSSNLKEYKYDWYWEKNSATGFAFAKYQPMRSIETISVFCKGTSPYFPQGLVPLKQPRRRIRHDSNDDSLYSKTLSGIEYIQKYSGYPKNVLRFKKDSKNRLHPTQKPVTLLEYLIKTYTKEDEIVLDNCMGSGSTAIACLNTGRRYIGFELSRTYYEKSLQRIKEKLEKL
jgi:DNA modification methylase